MTTAQIAVLGRQAGFRRDITSVARRALRQVKREPTSVLPAVFVPAFFYVVNLGALENVTSHASGLDYKAFAIPMATTCTPLITSVTLLASSFIT